MSRYLELPDEVYERLERASDQQGVAIPQLLARWAEVHTAEGSRAPQDEDRSDARRSPDAGDEPTQPLPDLAEAALLRQIRESLTGIEWEPYRALIQKRRDGTLTAEEQETLIAISDQIEEANARRIEWLGQLARLRGTSLRGIMRELGLAARPYA